MNASALSIVGWTVLQSLWIDAAVVAGIALIVRLWQPAAVRRERLGLTGLLLCVALPVTAALWAGAGITDVTHLSYQRETSTSRPMTTRGSGGAASPTQASGALQAESPAAEVQGQQPGSSIQRADERTVRTTTARYADRMAPFLGIAWLFGILIASLRLLASFGTQRRVRRSPHLTSPWPGTPEIESLGRSMGLRTLPRVVCTDRISVPMVLGVWRPTLVLPALLPPALTNGQRQMLIRHELAHICRRDPIWNWLQSCAEALIFHHQAVRWLSREVRDAREVACDAMASATPDEGSTLARALTAFASRAVDRSVPAATSGVLWRRIARLMGVVPDDRPGLRVVSIMSLVALGAYAPLSTVERPAWRAATAVEVAALPSAVQDRRDLGRQSKQLFAATDPARGQIQTPAVETHPTASTDTAITTAVGDILAVAPATQADLHSRFTRAAARISSPTLIGWIVDWGDESAGSVTSSTDGTSDAPGDGTVAHLSGEHLRNGVAIIIELTPSGRGVPREVLLRDMKSEVAREGRALVWLGIASDRESLALLEALQRTEPPPRIRRELAAALSVHPSSALVLDAVERLLGEERSADVRAEAMSWLARHTGRAPERVMALYTRLLLSDEPYEVLDEILSALRDSGDERGAHALILRTVLESKNAQARNEAVQVAAQWSDEGTLTTLERAAMRDESDAVRREAVDALGQSRSRSARAALDRIARDHSDSRIRRMAREALVEYER
ncbi:MAG: M56 family metallopeptidase [Gemmatimonadaceae bacterium]